MGLRAEGTSDVGSGVRPKNFTSQAGGPPLHSPTYRLLGLARRCMEGLTGPCHPSRPGEIIHGTWVGGG